MQLATLLRKWAENNRRQPRRSLPIIADTFLNVIKSRARARAVKSLGSLLKSRRSGQGRVSHSIRATEGVVEGRFDHPSM
jgi:hypothetical protein